MTATLQIIDDTQITQVAEQAYSDYKDEFIQHFEGKLKESIEIANQQFENGEYMTLDEFDNKLDLLE